MSLRVSDLIDFLNTLAPVNISEKRDVNGLQIGSVNDNVRGILLAVDPSLSAFKEAGKRGFNLVITHHPLFYEALTKVDLDTLKGKIIAFAIEKGINLLSWHTPLDKVPFGVSEALARKLGWQTEGFVVEEDEGIGWGRVVKFENYVNLESLAKEIKARLKSWVMIVGDPQEEVNAVALCGGSGGFLKDYLKETEINTLLTSDIKYHQAKDSSQEGFNFIIIDHGVAEASLLEVLREKLEAYFQEKNTSLPVEIYLEESPYKII